jgi:hypothetical protein
MIHTNEQTLRVDQTVWVRAPFLELEGAGGPAIMKLPIRTEDLNREGLPVKEIYGFSIFGYNKVPIPQADDPMILFLQHIAQTLPCAAHAGGLSVKNLDTIPTSVSPLHSDPYLANRVGLSCAEFYDLDGEFYCDGDSVFFPQVRNPLLGAKIEDFSELIEYDALALMIGASDDTTREMTALYSAPFPGHANWIRELTRIYDVVLLTGGDADFVKAVARDAEKFTVLERSIEIVQNAILASEWYRQHEPELLWDGEYGMCYQTPEMMYSPTT